MTKLGIGLATIFIFLVCTLSVVYFWIKNTIKSEYTSVYTYLINLDGSDLANELSKMTEDKAYMNSEFEDVRKNLFNGKTPSAFHVTDLKQHYDWCISQLANVKPKNTDEEPVGISASWMHFSQCKLAMEAREVIIENFFNGHVKAILIDHNFSNEKRQQAISQYYDLCIDSINLKEGPFRSKIYGDQDTFEEYINELTVTIDDCAFEKYTITHKNTLDN